MSDITTKFQSKHDLKYIFEISRVREGSFKNLWRLRVQTPGDGKLEEIVDADALSTVLDKIGWVFEMDGL